jgi:small-conductance mechanosensitive channel
MLLSATSNDSAHRWLTASLIAVVGAVVLFIANWLLRRGIRRLMPRLAASESIDVQRLETVATLGRRFLIAILGTIVAWQALDTFPATKTIAQTLLASSAVVALIVGFAVTIPLSNLGAGVLLGISQPVRLGDRTVVDGESGTVERITLIYTVLRNDLGLAVFIPNSRMASAVITNRTIDDSRVLGIARVPMRLGGDVAVARRLVLHALEQVEPRGRLETHVVVASVEPEFVWLAVEAFAPDGTRRTQLEAALREAALGALGAGGLLPTAD